MTPEELKNTAPNLFEIKNLKNGFHTPKGYFDAIDEQVFTSVFLDSLDKRNSFEIPEDYINSIETSVLDRIKAEDNSVPENYFETLEDSVFKKINEEPKVISLKQKIVQQFVPIAVAASILLIFTFQYFSSNQNNDFASINGDDIEFWLNNGDLDFNDNELAYLYENTEIESVDVFDFYKEEEVLDYLNDLDVESLILSD